MTFTVRTTAPVRIVSVAGVSAAYAYAPRGENTVGRAVGVVSSHALRQGDRAGALHG